MSHSANALQLPTTSAKPSALMRVRWQTWALIAVVLLAAGLRLANMQSIGNANAYYTAAVTSMLQSPSNFFFVAAEPGGGVSVDKPPVALWIQAVFGAVLGVSGFTVTLPEIIAGVLSVLLLYHLVRKQFGDNAGLIAAFVLAVMPVSVAVDRTNNVDSILILALLLGTWALLRAIESGKWRDLALTAALVGVGFNIKMLQAYLVLPAFYALYFLAAPVSWRRKIVHLAAATVVLLIVSFSWAAVVDLTPASQRPYVGSSQTNSVFELAVGYNGLQRLLGMNRGGGGGFRMPGGVFSFDVGTPGALRMFIDPLVNEIGWLLPLGLAAVLCLAVSRRVRFPIAREHQAVVLWGGWLMTGVVFFSLSEFFHSYYLATLAPPLAALIGIGAVQVWGLKNRAVRSVLALLVVVGGVAFQLYTVNSYKVGFTVETLVVIALLILGIGALVYGLRQPRSFIVAGVALLGAVLITPTAWAFATSLNTNSGMDATLPSAYRGGASGGFSLPGMGGAGVNGMISGMGSIAEPLIGYFQTHPSNSEYLVAVSSALIGSRLVIETKQPVLFLGGFTGSDPIYTVEDIAQMIGDGRLRYFLSGGMMGGVMGGGSQRAIEQWVSQNCTVVTDMDDAPPPTTTANTAAIPAAPNGFVLPGIPTPSNNPIGGLARRIAGAAGGMKLYDCQP